MIHAIAVQRDGKIIIGGQFESVDGIPAFRIARLNLDGSRDGTFPFVDPDNEVRAITLQPDGKIVFGGVFFSVNGNERLRIARLNSDGILDLAFSPRIDNGVSALAAQGTAIVLGGSFARVNGEFRYNIARINQDGTLAEIFAPIVRSGTCNALAVVGMKVLAAGQFREASPDYSIVRLNEDGSTDTNFFRYEPGFNATALAVQPDGKILVHANSDAMRLYPNGTLDESFQRYPGPSSHVYSIAVQPDGKIIMAGRFTTYHGIAANHIVRLNTNGSVDTTFSASVNTNINTIALQVDGRVLIGGTFSEVNGVPRTRIARLLGDYPVLDVALVGTNVTLSWPTNYSGYQLQTVAALPAVNWTPVPTQPSVSESMWTVTNLVTPGNAFFRLTKPNNVTDYGE